MAKKFQYNNGSPEEVESEKLTDEVDDESDEE